MYLKEFDLDLAYSVNDERIRGIINERKCGYDEATRFDYELHWKMKRRSFSLQTRCMTAMYERLFKKLKLNAWKVIVECIEDDTDRKIVNDSGVFIVPIRFNSSNLKEFESRSDVEKKQTTLRLLMEGIEKLAFCNNWDLQPFKEVAMEIEELGYFNEWVWKKAVRSPNKNYAARVICQHHVQSMDIHMAVMYRDGTQVLLEKVKTELPDEFAYARHLGKLIWINDRQVALVNTEGDKQYIVTI